MKTLTVRRLIQRLLQVASACAVISAVHPDARPHRKPAALVSQRYNWRSVAIVAGGFVSGIQFHPGQKDLAYARTDIGGAYRWDPKSNRWIPLQDWLTKPDWNLYGIESLGLDPSDPRRLYLACGTYTNEWGHNGAILRSTDQGRTFQRTDLPFKFGGNENGRSIGERLAVDPNAGHIVYFGTRTSGLWRSTDYGSTWSQLASFPIKTRTNGIGIGIVVFDARGGQKGQASKTIYAFADSGEQPVYRSSDAGATWKPVAAQPRSLMPHQAALTSDGTLYITYGDSPGPNGMSDGAVWKLDTRSGKWTDISPVKPHDPGERGFGYAGLSVDAHDPKRLVVSSMDRWNPGDDVFLSEDAGMSWVGMREKSVRDPSAAPYMTWGKPAAQFGWWIGAVAMDPFNPSRVLYGTGANIWGSDDVSNAQKGLATHWNVRGVGIEETADIDLLSPPTGPHLITALGDIGGFTHTDLEVPPPGMTLNPLLSTTDSLDFAELTPTNVVRVGRGNEKHGGYSLDAGLTWRSFDTEPAGTRAGGSVAITSQGSAIVWAPTGRGVFLSNDRGSTWHASKGVPSGVWLVADRVNPAKLYALSRDGELYASVDGGATFSVTAQNLPIQHGKLRAVPGKEGQLWLPSDFGLLYSSDSGHGFSLVPGVDIAESVGFGMAAPDHNYPTVFVNGQVQSVYGVFRSDDMGSSWVRVTDAAHEYGHREIVIGDPRVFGRVFVGTNGRGVLYGDPR